MKDNQVSLTALITAYVRAYHSIYDEPKIFDDFLAKDMLTKEELENIGDNLAKAIHFFDPEGARLYTDKKSALARVMRIQSAPITLSRSKYTEDVLKRIIDNGISQYIILGAGLDTFAFRNPEIMKQLKVFELDHTATQSEKCERINELGWKYPENLHLIPIDFSKENISTVLKKTEYNHKELSLFSWLGVTYYLTPEVVFETLKEIANITPSGSMIIFDYLDEDAFDSQKASKQVQLMQQAVKMTGEPLKAGFNPSNLASKLEDIGLKLHLNLSPSDIEDLYFQDKTDDYHSFPHLNIACIVVK